MNRPEKIRRPWPLQICSKLLLRLLFGVIVHVWMSPVVSSRDEPPPRQGGSKLGGYETPPPANHVPEHLFDIILGRPTDRGVTLRVLAYENLAGRIRFGYEAGRYTSETPLLRLNQGEPVDFVIDSLAGDSRCFYRFEYHRKRDQETQQSEEFTFHTQRKPGSVFVFTVQADSHLDENTSSAVYENTLANALQDTPDFHLELGDTFMVDKYVRPELSFGQYLAQRYYFGKLCHSAPLFFVPGNHDGEGGDRGSNLWPTLTRKQYFPNPSPNEFYSGNSVQEPSVGYPENYYSWQWGNSQFIVLDPFRHTTKRQRNKGERTKNRDDQAAAGNWDPWERTLGQVQYDWLKSVLQKSDAQFKFVFLHHLSGGKDRSARGGVEIVPYFEWGGKNLQEQDEFARMRPGWEIPIHQLLVKHHVSVVFHGHDHLFVKQDLDGIVYQEVPQPGYSRLGNIRSAREYGYLRGEVQSSSGHLRVHVSEESTRVDYVRSYLSSQENSQRKNGDVTYSYLITGKKPILTD